MVFTKKEKERFFEKTVRNTNGCLEWTGFVDKFGYGRVFLHGKANKVHRIVWEMLVGKIPKGYGYHGICVCHKCDNRKCVEINHLFLGTQQENVLDSIIKGRHISPDWSGDNNPQSRVSRISKIKPWTHAKQ